MGAISEEERASVIARSPVGIKYDRAINRESAYEILARRALESAPPTGSPNGSSSKEQEERSPVGESLWGTKRRQGMVETMAKQAARTVGSQVGRQILRGILGGLLRNSRPR